MLFERVRKITKTIAVSQTALATELGLKQNKFYGYLNATSEKNLWQYLPRILELFPQVSRDWLYFGEGEMLRGGGERNPPTPHIDVALLQQVLEMLEEHLQAIKGKLSPARKAVVVSQLYELIVEQEEQAREPIQMMRLIMGALAKVSNG